MKTNKIIGSIAVCALGFGLASCSDSYLDVMPDTQVAAEEVTATTTAAQLAVNGIAASMLTQYQETSWNQYSGEAYLNTLWNDAIGQDYISGLFIAFMGNKALKGENWNNDRGLINDLMWRYCYNTINMANGVINGIDEAEGEQEERDFVKAEALTFRAYFYTKLLQYYAPRWDDGAGKDEYCMVLRLKQGTEPTPLVTMGAVLDQVYKDLDTAIECFKSSGMSRQYKWLPDISVAYGVYARAALVKNDWKTAQEMAHNARQGYKVMDNKTYLSGFFQDNDEIMLTQSDLDEDIYYWSWGSHYAVNGIYVTNWGLGAGAIDLDFYRTLDPRDIRRQCYLTPDKVDVINAYKPAWNPAKLTEASFFSDMLCDATNYCTLAFGDAVENKMMPGSWGMKNFVVRYGQYYLTEVFTGDADAMVNTALENPYSAYYTISGKGDVLVSKGKYATLCACVPLGAQYKFWSNTPYGTGCVPFMRAAEMVLAEAEAAYWNNDVTTAQNCLNEINGVRIPGYKCTLTGEDLWKEVVKTRRIELWGEGHNWTDFKRWKLPINRRPWVKDDVTSGNWTDECAGAVPVEENYGWRLKVPAGEFEFNSAIDRSLLPWGRTEEE